MKMVFRRRIYDFHYWRDPLFVLCVIVYFLNRWIIKPITLGKVWFFHDYFNDLICLPFWLPIVLLVTRKIRLRDHDGPPSGYEIGFYLFLWSFMFEFFGPYYGRFFHYPVSDPWDIVCYAAGGLLAGVYWNFGIRRAVPSKHC